MSGQPSSNSEFLTKKKKTVSKNPFCFVFAKNRVDRSLPVFEHIQDCGIRGGQEVIKRGDPLKHQNYCKALLNYFLPRFKVLLNYCQCEGRSCLETVRGWNCSNCNSAYCKTGNDYCISLERGKQILLSTFENPEFLTKTLTH